MFQTNLKKKLILFAIFAAVVLIFWSSTLLQEEYGRLVSFFGNQVTAKPVLSIFIFLVLTVFSMMFLFFSNFWLVPIAVSVWGSLMTTVLLLAGWLLGAIFSYLLGRYAGYPILKYFIPTRTLDYFHNLFFRKLLPSLGLSVTLHLAFGNPWLYLRRPPFQFPKVFTYHHVG